MNRLTCLMTAFLSASFLIVGGCKKEESTAISGSPGAPTRPASKELKLFAWTEYVPQAVLDGFQKEYGVEVKYEAYDANEQMLAKVMPGSDYDLIQPSEYTVEYLLKNQKLLPLDKSKLTNFANLSPDILNLAHDPGNKFTVPWMTGNVGIIYNTEKVKEPITGYADVFKDAYKGRIVVLDDSREIVTWAAATLGVQSNDVTSDTLKKVKPILAKWLPLVGAYDSTDPKGKLRTGEVDLGVTWNGEAARLLAEDAAAGTSKWRYVIPKEGGHRFIDSLCIPVGAKNIENAHLFMNYILRPEVGVLIAREYPYTSPNAKAREMLTAAERNNLASYPTETSFETFKDLDEALIGDMDKLVTELKAR